MRSFTTELARRNRLAFQCAAPWLPESAYQASRDGYGVSDHARRLLDLPIDDEPTYTDVLTAIANEFGRPIRYLEIGVSVGKNFYCMTQALEHSEIFGLDWEEMNPTLERLFSAAAPLRPSIRSYRAQSNMVHYVRGDEMAPETWTLLGGRTFDIIFSDAWHHGTALLTEFEMLVSLNLLHLPQFFIMWDDLTGRPDASMDRAYAFICDELKALLDPTSVEVGTLEVNGWLGQHEPPHRVGFATNALTASALRAGVESLRTRVPRAAERISPG